MTKSTTLSYIFHHVQDIEYVDLLTVKEPLNDIYAIMDENKVNDYILYSP